MRRRFSFVALVISGTCFIVTAGSWWALNHFRREFYNSSIEGPSPATSPYWAIIRAQDLLIWPIFLSLGVVVLMFLVKSGHYVMSRVPDRAKAED